LRVVALTAKTPPREDYFGVWQEVDKLMVKRPQRFGQGRVFVDDRVGSAIK
jgi:hypothetical protein